MCGGDIDSHRFPLFRCQTAHTSVRGDLSLIPATEWRGCVKQIGKRLSETQWLIQASACRHSIADTSRSCAPGLKTKVAMKFPPPQKNSFFFFLPEIGLGLKGLNDKDLIQYVVLSISTILI